MFVSCSYKNKNIIINNLAEFLFIKTKNRLYKQISIIRNLQNYQTSFDNHFILSFNGRFIHVYNIFEDAAPTTDNIIQIRKQDYSIVQNFLDKLDNTRLHYEEYKMFISACVNFANSYKDLCSILPMKAVIELSSFNAADGFSENAIDSTQKAITKFRKKWHKGYTLKNKFMLYNLLNEGI